MESTSQMTGGKVEDRIKFLLECQSEVDSWLRGHFTSFATVSIPFIRGEVPYLSEFASTWSRTLPTNSLSCKGPDHIGPASWNNGKRLHAESDLWYSHGKLNYIQGTCLILVVRY